jgi:hypothetical protein
LGWLAAAGYGYQALRDNNAASVTDVADLGRARRSHGASDTRLAGRAGGTLMAVTPKPVPPDQIKTPPISIGIEEGRGGARPVPPPAPPKT